MFIPPTENFCVSSDKVELRRLRIFELHKRIFPHVSKDQKLLLFNAYIGWWSLKILLFGYQFTVGPKGFYVEVLRLDKQYSSY